jgi:AcrR family transcriptional regulator
MPKGSAELTNSRREEIIAACRKLFQSTSYKEITIKEIAEETSFTRPSIYNYFETKEEIFLALFQQEYESVSVELNLLCQGKEVLSLEDLASALAKALDKRPMLLKLLSMNLYDMEANARLERLVEFKTAYRDFISALDRCLRKFCPAFDEQSRQTFLYSFLPFMFGLYPYTVATDKQKAAMEKAGIDYTPVSTYELAYSGIRILLKGLQERL